MTENENVTVTVTDENFPHVIAQYPGLAVVDFGASWCPPCRLLSPIIDALAKEYDGRARIGKLDVDENPLTSAQFKVRSLPTILFFRSGELAATIVGAVSRSELQRRIEELLGGAPRMAA